MSYDSMRKELDNKHNIIEKLKNNIDPTLKKPKEQKIDEVVKIENAVERKESTIKNRGRLSIKRDSLISLNNNKTNGKNRPQSSIKTIKSSLKAKNKANEMVSNEIKEESTIEGNQIAIKPAKRAMSSKPGTKPKPNNTTKPSKSSTIQEGVLPVIGKEKPNTSKRPTSILSKK